MDIMRFSDCVEKDPSKAEVLLLFSEAALGAARLDRDRETQALLPLNPAFVCGRELEEVLDDGTCQSIIASLGAGIVIPGYPEIFDITKLRYGKVILITEQGEAGSRLRNEVLQFFSTYMRPLIDAGHLFVTGTSLKPGFKQEVVVQNILDPATRSLRVVVDKG